MFTLQNVLFDFSTFGKQQKLSIGWCIFGKTGIIQRQITNYNYVRTNRREFESQGYAFGKSHL